MRYIALSPTLFISGKNKRTEIKIIDMKTKLNFKQLIIDVLIVVFVLTASSELLAQEKKSTDLKDFKVLVEKTDNGIKMICENGCAWKELTYSINDYKPQAIDEYGMTELNKNSLDKDSNLTDFLFILTKTEKGIKLKGIEGTARTDLSFSLSKNKQKAIDQLGMIN